MGNKKNILLMVPRLNIGGAETYTAMVAEKLQQRGYQVYTASGGGLLAEHLKKQGIKNCWLPMRFSTDISAYLLKHIVNKYNIDIIHANSAAAGITAMKFKERYKNLPVIFTAHGIFGDMKKEKILQRCDRIIYVSQFMKRDSLAKGFTEDNACVIYTGIDAEKFNKNFCHKELRETFGIQNGDFTIAIVARIKNLFNKGHADLLNVMNEHEDARKWHLLVVGKGKGLIKLKKLVKKYNLTKNVHCIGHVDNVQDYVAIANVIALPSDFETFGLALAEGMMMGKAGVAYDVGGISEIIQDGENGFLVKHKDADDLYNKLKVLADNRVLCEIMGKNANSYIEKHFSCEKMMKEIESVYNKF